MKKLIILVILLITAISCIYDSRDWSEYNKPGKEKLLSVAETQKR